MGRLKLIALSLLFLMIQWMIPQSMDADETPSAEYLLKAAFLYNFARFVEWPYSAFSDIRSPLRLCILGEDPFGKAIETITGKSVAERKLEIITTKRLENTEECHILFISRSEEKRMATILELVRKKAVLTVSEADDFLRMGGMIQLMMEENKVRFSINQSAAERGNFMISSKLLKLAHHVVKD